MRVVHDSGRVLASNVDRAEGVLAKGRGLMFRRSIPPDYGLVFPFSRTARRSIHMVCVPFPIDVCWLAEGRVRETATLPAWRGYGAAVADTVVEFPAGTLTGVEVGDRVRVE
ncbi:DUF192 domain-containing protein [Halomarina ordinaria]|uniref:DUF192 domain-containing protein n=1 Tax=Halomarina ordinaria TaxID=3033939 RepID=A0ABD5UCK7_9EURY|nr:DUF192 domain-containing protein [Halomarina sp. PSRA2]